MICLSKYTFTFFWVHTNHHSIKLLWVIVILIYVGMDFSWLKSKIECFFSKQVLNNTKEIVFSAFIGSWQEPEKNQHLWNISQIHSQTYPWNCYNSSTFLFEFREGQKGLEFKIGETNMKWSVLGYSVHSDHWKSWVKFSKTAPEISHTLKTPTLYISVMISVK